MIFAFISQSRGVDNMKYVFSRMRFIKKIFGNRIACLLHSGRYVSANYMPYNILLTMSVCVHVLPQGCIRNGCLQYNRRAFTAVNFFPLNFKGFFLVLSRHCCIILLLLIWVFAFSARGSLGNAD